MRRLCFYTCLSFCSQWGECLGRYPPGQVHPPGRYTPWQVHPPEMHAGIWSTSGRYASSWDAFLFAYADVWRSTMNCGFQVYSKNHLLYTSYAIYFHANWRREGLIMILTIWKTSVVNGWILLSCIERIAFGRTSYSKWRCLTISCTGIIHNSLASKLNGDIIRSHGSYALYGTGTRTGTGTGTIENKNAFQ